MKTFLVFVVMTIVVVAAIPLGPNVVPLIERSEVHDERGQFSLRYVTGDGISHSERGVLKPSHDGRGYVLVKEGEYLFYAPDGKLYRTKYVADDKGFRAYGDHLPKSPVA